MKDAELMTTLATVPGLEVQLRSQEFTVIFNGEVIGSVDHRCTVPDFIARSFCSFGAIDIVPTRNEAVQWILDQHKAKGEK